MNEFLENSLFAGVTISLLAYMAGAFLKKKFKIALLNPLLISIILSIVVLVTADIDYDVYNAGASYLSWFLTPATVCLAIPLYEQWQLLKKNWKAVMFGILAGTLTSGVTVFMLAKFMSLSHTEYVTLLPKVDYNGNWHGAFRRVRRLCYHYGSSDCCYRCGWQYVW